MVLGQAEGQHGRIRHVLVRVTIQLDPGKIAEHQGVALVRPDIPRRAQRSIDGRHYHGQAIESRHHHVLGHVGEPVRCAGGESPGAVQGGADADTHRTVLAFGRYDAALREREAGHVFDDFGLRCDRINAADRAAGVAIGLARNAHRVAHRVVAGYQMHVHCHPAFM